MALVSIAAVSQASGSGPSLAAVGFWAIFGALVAGEHLFLDSLTQAGVYSWSGRIAIAHFSYDNTALNLGFALLGVVLIMAALGV